jgi:putative drug exporter of the RND superfamily
MTAFPRVSRHGKGAMGSDGDGARRRVTRETAFYRLGAFALRGRRFIVAIWILVVVLAFPFLGKLADRLSQGGFEVPGSQSDRVKTSVEQNFHRSALTDTLVLHSDSVTVQDPAFRRTYLRVRTALLNAPDVVSVSDPFSGLVPAVSKDGHTATSVVELSGTQDTALKHAPQVSAAVDRAARGSSVRALVTGSAPFYKAFSDTTTHDLKRAETIAFPITLVILLVVFGSLLAAGMPLAMAIVSLLIAFGAVSIIAAQTTVSIFAENLMSMVGIGVGIDYSLFILTRYREELRRGHAVEEAIPLAMASSGKAVFVSAVTVVVALAGTQLVNIAAFRSMGWGAMIAVTVASAAALTLLPALMGAVGRKIDSVRVRRRPAGERDSRVWHRWAVTVMRRPWIALTASLAILLLLAAPVLHMQLGSSGTAILPSDSEPRVASELVARAFGAGQVAPVEIVVRDPEGVTTHGFGFVYGLARALARDPEVEPRGVRSIATLVPAQTEDQARAFVSGPAAAKLVAPFLANGGRETLIQVVTRHDAQAPESGDFVKRARGLIARTAPPGISADVGGDPGLNQDLNAEVGGKLVPVVALVMVLSYLVLLLFFRSLLLPLKAVLMNTASVVAVYGLLTFVFQDGHFEGLLSFQSGGVIESFIPLFLFCVLFGLSMDYEVFLLARIREEYLKTGDNTEAVGWGLERTASIITSAALVMVTVFGAFVFASLVPIKSMGFGLATAVLIDATLVRVVLVPAAMRLMGRWNWWLPKWLDRRLPNVSLEGTGRPKRVELKPARIAP